MTRKIRCPQCGAKNAGEADRCRMCGAMIAGTGALDAGMDDGGDVLPDLQPVDPRSLPPFDDEQFDPTEIGQPWTSTAPPPPTRDDPVVSDVETFDFRDLDVDTSLYRKPKGPPIVNEDEQFEPIAIDLDEFAANPDAPPLGEDEVARFVPIERE